MFDALRRWPDHESPELRAWDAADSLILDAAEGGALAVSAAVAGDAALAGGVALAGGNPFAGRDVVVIGDEYGALTLGALERGAASVRVNQDTITGEQALLANAAARRATLQPDAARRSAPAPEPAQESRFAQLPLDTELVAGATLVLVRLPRSLDALEDIAALVAAHADPAVIVIAGGRIKHMTTGMNEVLARHFGRVDVSLARQKSRLLIAREPVLGEVPALRTRVPRRSRPHGVARRAGSSPAPPSTSARAPCSGCSTPSPSSREPSTSGAAPGFSRRPWRGPGPGAR